MARYIDAEALTDSMLEHYNELCEKYGDYDHYTTGYGDAIDAIENAPTEDVVPRAELEHLLSDFKKEIHDKAVYPEARSVKPYISLKVVDAIIINKMEEIRNEKEN